MVNHSWSNYLEYARGHDDLMPLSCSGRRSHGGFNVTLIDGADTLAVVGDIPKFKEAVEMISKSNFHINSNVSVFETTIRVLGGLLSTHIQATKLIANYDSKLLDLAIDLGNRLSLAFNTETGIPYSDVNLIHGPFGDVTCTACAGTLTLEFGVLSQLSKNKTYYKIAKRAVGAIWSRRSNLNLVGKRINVHFGFWTDKTTGISEDTDSFFEYLWKCYVAFGDQDMLKMFITAYDAIEKNVYFQTGSFNYHMQVDMDTGNITNVAYQSLQAFWPGLQASMGLISDALKNMKPLVAIHRNSVFVPDVWGSYMDYPLRPEVIESIYYITRQTPEYIPMATEILDRLNKYCRTKCGFSGISTKTLEKIDHMESFFISETLKYLYLIFDHENSAHSYVFSTQGHMFPIFDSNYSLKNTKCKDFRSGCCAKN